MVAFLFKVSKLLNLSVVKVSKVLNLVSVWALQPEAKVIATCNSEISCQRAALDNIVQSRYDIGNCSGVTSHREKQITHISYLFIILTI